jgi:EAL domain-containing protein (putative c-di-GMP-specific phosphodiesterase class I)
LASKTAIKASGSKASTTNNGTLPAYNADSYHRFTAEAKQRVKAELGLLRSKHHFTHFGTLDSSTGLENLKQLHNLTRHLLKKKRQKPLLLYVQVHNLNELDPSYLPKAIESLVTITNKVIQEPFSIFRVRSKHLAIMVHNANPSHSIDCYAKQIVERYSIENRRFHMVKAPIITLGCRAIDDSLDYAYDYITAATKACYYAKHAKKSPITIHDESSKPNIERFFYIDQGIEKAIENGEIYAVFQPIVDVDKNEVISFEALARWKSPLFGDIYPDEFIPVAEGKGSIYELGLLIFKAACQFIKQYQLKHGNQVSVSVNVSALQLMESRFPQQLISLAVAEGVNLKHIVLELTETVLVDQNNTISTQLEQLSAAGFKLALDDFGAGLTSIQSFFLLPFKQIKIDKNLTWLTMTNSMSEQFVRFIATLSQAHQIKVVAEGVENIEQQNLMKSMGIKRLQGYFYSRPLLVSNALEFVNNCQSNKDCCCTN